MSDTDESTDETVEMGTIRSSAQRLIAWLRGVLTGDASAPVAPVSESDRDRDGFLSYTAEWHALSVGLFAGITYAITGREAIAGVVAATVFGLREARTGHMKDVRKEAGYTGGGFLFGVGAGVLLRELTGLFGGLPFG